MATWTFPLDRDSFFATLPVSEQTFELSETVEVSGLADGSVLQDEIGPRLWRGRCTIDRLSLARARDVEARIALLQGPGRSFLVWRLDSAAPLADPGGAGLAGFTPVIQALPADARELRLGGLPPGYVLSPGDMLSFPYATGPVRHALHRVVSDPVVTDAAGITPPLELTPPLRPGAALATPVDLLRPACKAIIVPGSVTPGSLRRNALRGLAFDFLQTLR